MHKKTYTTLAQSLVDDTTAVANHLAEDNEEPLSDDEGRVFTARSLKWLRPTIIARALRLDVDDVRDALAEIAAAEKAAAAEEDAEQADADAA